MNDKEIIDLYWKRQETAIRATAEKYGRFCHTVSYNILHNNEDAEECVNDTYLGAWNSIPPNYPNRLSAYLAKITRNFAINRFKSYHAKKRNYTQTALALSELEDCIPAPGNVEESVEEMVLVDVLQQFLYGLPEQKRHIFIRRYWYLTPVKEIAHSYGMSESKITSLLFRMRRELRAYLEKEGIVL